MKKIFIISLLLLLPFNVYALKTTSGEFPAIPNDAQYWMIYLYDSNPTHVALITFPSETMTGFINCTGGDSMPRGDAQYWLTEQDTWLQETSYRPNNTRMTPVYQVLATTIEIGQSGNACYFEAGYGLPIDKSLIIYVPGVDSYSCVVVRDSNVIRAYKEAPATNATIPYRDYYYNSHYLYNDGEQTFSQYATLPSCINSKYLTSEFYYRTDLADIAIIMFAFIFILYFVWFHIVKKVVPKF